MAQFGRKNEKIVREGGFCLGALLPGSRVFSKAAVHPSEPVGCDTIGTLVDTPQWTSQLEYTIRTLTEHSNEPVSWDIQKEPWLTTPATQSRMGYTKGALAAGLQQKKPAKKSHPNFCETSQIFLLWKSFRRSFSFSANYVSTSSFKMLQWRLITQKICKTGFMIMAHNTPKKRCKNKFGSFISKSLENVKNLIILQKKARKIQESPDFLKQPSFL